jgi:ABC-type uncharacterized transport system permease subunit
MRNALDVFQFDHAIRQQTQRPMVMPVRCGAASDGDQMRFGLAVEGTRAMTTRALFQRRVEPGQRKTFANVRNGIGMHVIGRTDLFIGPAGLRMRRVSLEQHVSAFDLAC